MSSIVIGLGQIGSAVKAVTESEYSLDLNSVTVTPTDGYDVMHICFPYSDSFEQQLRSYAATYRPQHIAVWSTVPIGTCEGIDVRIVHTPVESKHPDLELGIRHMTRWIGHNDVREGRFFDNYFKNLNLRTKLVDGARFTEALKLISTTEYGINIVFADYKKRIADDLEMPFELTKEWNKDYNYLYQQLGLGGKFQKFVLDPPNGKIGGHCVRENSILLNEQYPDEWVKRIGDMK